MQGNALILAGAAFVAAMALAAPTAAQSTSGLDVRVTKTCDSYPANGPTAIRCVVNVGNFGTVGSIAPLTIVDTPTGPIGTVYLGSSSSIFPCTTAAGGMPATINCGANLSLLPGAPTATGSRGTLYLDFRLPPSGGVFRNCVRALSTHNPAIPDDVNPANNETCTSVTVPPSVVPAPDISATKACNKGANRSVICQIVIRNNGTTTSGPISVTDTLMGPLPGTSYTGASGSTGVTCGPAQNPYVSPINCTLPSIPGGQTRTVILSFTVTGNGTFSNAVAVNQGGSAVEANVMNNGTIVRVTMP